MIYHGLTYEKCKLNQSKLFEQFCRKNLTDNLPLAIIKLYFKQRYALETQEDITGNWVELLSTYLFKVFEFIILIFILLGRYGGIMSLMYGFSIVSTIELFYYSTGKWFTHIYRAYQQYKERKVHSNEISKGAIATQSMRDKNIAIYWNELTVNQINLNNFENAVLKSYKKQ